ncbi:hypothetical protein ACFVZH_22630 [Streptomyces sp. NPDC059534]|uniref:hypothetical protein n=1 Tax=Streptomyces sp. NPDC059534 TaxID=3346859 RepID=UPI003689DEA0
MKIRQDIADMLRAGHSQAAIEKALHVDHRTVSAARVALGLPPRKPGTKPETVEETFARRTREEDGHLIWLGHDYAISTIEGASYSAARWSFQQHHGRPPVGKVFPGCGVKRCVHPCHVEDQPMRQALKAQLARIFGSTA